MENDDAVPTLGLVETELKTSRLEAVDAFADKMVSQMWSEVFNAKHPKFHDTAIGKSQAVVDWLTLPQEIWLTILSYLTQSELYFIVYRVCKLWGTLCRDISLWRSIDFNKMRKDLEVMNEMNCYYVPYKITEAHFKNLLSVFCEHLTSLKMSRFTDDCSLHDTTVKYLCMCTKIRTLDLGFCEDVKLKTICENCTCIEVLKLEGCRNLHDEDFENIFLLRNLDEICVSHSTSLTDKFLTSLYNLPNLRALFCDGVMSITEMGLVEFLQHQPLMEILVLDGEDMTDDLVCYAALNLPKLTVFELSFCQSLTSRSILSFQGKYQIESLKFRKANEITGTSICKVFSPSTTFQLKNFAITESEHIDDNALTCLSQSCPLLQSLTVDWCWNISDEGLYQVVNNCKMLERLSLIGLFAIEGVGWLDSLDKCLPHLIYLDVTDCNNMPDKDLTELVRRKRNIEVYTYYHERVTVSSVSSDESNNTSFDDQPESLEWSCPGERGAQVIF